VSSPSAPPSLSRAADTAAVAAAGCSQSGSQSGAFPRILAHRGGRDHAADLHRCTSADITGRLPADLLIRGFGVRVPGGAPCLPWSEGWGLRSAAPLSCSCSQRCSRSLVRLDFGGRDARGPASRRPPGRLGRGGSRAAWVSPWRSPEEAGKNPVHLQDRRPRQPVAEAVPVELLEVIRLELGQPLPSRNSIQSPPSARVRQRRHRQLESR